VKTVPLGDLAAFVMGQAPPGETCNHHGHGTPFVKAGEFGENRPEIQAWTTRPLQLAKSTDVLVCVVGATSGKVNLGVDCAIGRSVAAVRPLPDRLDQRFTYHFLKTQTLRLRGSSQGSAQGVLTRGMLAELAMLALPLSDQRRIADVLEKADAIRRKRQEAVALTEQLLRSTFLEMFGDPVTNPKGWPTVDLGQLLSDGPTNGLYRPASDYGSGTPIVRIDSFHDGEIKDLESLKRVRIPDDVIKKFGLAPGHVLVNRVNSPEHLGKSALVPQLTEPTVFESNMMRLTLDQDALCSEFLISQMMTPHIKQQIATCRKDASNQSSINQDDVRGFQIRLPPIEQQRRYRAVIEVTNSHRRKLRRALVEAEALFNSLVQRAFSGQL
jgi:type I restriction enzyme S subunit